MTARFLMPSWGAHPVVIHAQRYFNGVNALLEAMADPWRAEMLGQGRDAAKQHLRDNAELATRLDYALRERLLNPRRASELPAPRVAAASMPTEPTEAAA